MNLSSIIEVRDAIFTIEHMYGIEVNIEYDMILMEYIIHMSNNDKNETLRISNRKFIERPTIEILEELINQNFLKGGLNG